MLFSLTPVPITPSFERAMPTVLGGSTVGGGGGGGMPVYSYCANWYDMPLFPRHYA